MWLSGLLGTGAPARLPPEVVVMPESVTSSQHKHFGHIGLLPRTQDVDLLMANC